ncbi:hypothetical protein EOD39_1549 [Acipenser ruthenus]|uniref:Uncharacterized protein n=1 Tax=Acipenser ruthenus TaxID=7906 RepID=A0A444UAB8_ACIRT|nr:hypothetical protein EOD39_1549 [Acipenser ruthenus]
MLGAADTSPVTEHFNRDGHRADDITQRAILEQNLRFQRGLLSEAEGLDRMQDLSRPWVYYFQLLEMLGLLATPEGVPEEA